MKGVNIGNFFEIVTEKCNKTQNLGGPCNFEKPPTPNFKPYARMHCIAGPRLPQGCIGGAMATLPNSNEAVLIGCNDGNRNGLEKIFKIFWQDDDLVWEILPQELKYPRTEAIAMFVPDSPHTECTSKGKTQISLGIKRQKAK